MTYYNKATLTDNWGTHTGTVIAERIGNVVTIKFVDGIEAKNSMPPNASWDFRSLLDWAVPHENVYTHNFYWNGKGHFGFVVSKSTKRIIISSGLEGLASGGYGLYGSFMYSVK